MIIQEKTIQGNTRQDKAIQYKHDKRIQDKPNIDKNIQSNSKQYTTIQDNIITI